MNTKRPKKFATAEESRLVLACGSERRSNDKSRLSESYNTEPQKEIESWSAS